MKFFEKDLRIMKRSLLLAAMPLILGLPQASAKTELEILRARCKEQELQIRELEQENSQLSGALADTRGKSKRIETVSSVIKSEGKIVPGSANYEVKEGDTFWKIARRFGTSAEQLAAANGLKLETAIVPGQDLKVPTKAAVAPRPAPTPPETSTTKVSGRTHELKDGETFTSISRKYGIPVDALVAANPSLNPNRLRPGETIRLAKSSAAASPKPTSSKPDAVVEKAPARKAANTLVSSPASKPAPKATASKPESKSTPASEPKKEPAPSVVRNSEPPPAKTAETPTPAKKAQLMTIDTETNYGDFAAKHGTDTQRLNSLNGFDFTDAIVLARGSKVWVPAQP